MGWIHGGAVLWPIHFVVFGGECRSYCMTLSFLYMDHLGYSYSALGGSDPELGDHRLFPIQPGVVWKES